MTRTAKIAAADRLIRRAECVIAHHRGIIASNLRGSPPATDASDILDEMLTILGEMRRYRDDLLNEMGYGRPVVRRKPRLELVLVNAAASHGGLSPAPPAQHR